MGNLKGKGNRQNGQSWEAFSSLGVASFSMPLQSTESKMINIPILDEFDVNMGYLIQK